MPPSDLTQTPITRRRLAALTAAGGSAFVLAACGTDANPNAGKSDTELLGYISIQLTGLLETYERPADSIPSDLAAAFADQLSQQNADLNAALNDLGAEQGAQSDAPAGAETVTSANGGTEQALIAVINSVVPDLGDSDLQELAYQLGAASGGRTAALAATKGQDPAPTAFVLGKLPSGIEGID